MDQGSAADDLDLLVTGGRVVSADDERALDVGVRDGRIVALLEPGTPAIARKRIDATGLLVLPGGIDTHTHSHWPFGSAVTTDGFDGATRAAATGGTTTMVDFVPPLRPEQGLRQACHDRIGEIERQAYVDVALHPILNRADAGVVADVGAAIDLGCTSFKMYTTYEENLVDDGEVWRLMREIARHGGLPGFHAENHGVIIEAGRHAEEVGRLEVSDFPLSRPALAEALAISTLARMGRDIGTPIYVFHVSGAEAFAAIEDAREGGATVHAETCTHYLAYDDSVFSRPDAWKFVITPAIRGNQDRIALWEAVADGRLDTVGSDHCAYPLSAKSEHPEDHRLTPPGAAGVQSRTPVLWNETVNRRGLSPCTFVQVSAERAARVLGMHPGKGAIRVGADADLVVFDPDAEWTGADLAPASADTFDLYQDYSGRGLPRHVLLRGRELVADGTFVGTPGAGGFLPREPISQPA